MPLDTNQVAQHMRDLINLTSDLDTHNLLWKQTERRSNTPKCICALPSWGCDSQLARLSMKGSDGTKRSHTLDDEKGLRSNLCSVMY